MFYFLIHGVYLFVYIYFFPFKCTWTKVLLKHNKSPLCLKTFFCPPGSVSVVFVRYDSVGDILKPSGDPGLTDYSRYAGTGEITVNSPVIAAAVKPADIYQLDHVTFTLRHNEVKTVQSADPG